MKRGLALLGVFGAMTGLRLLVAVSARGLGAGYQAASPSGADLSVRKRGPATVRAGMRLTCTLIVSNMGQLAAPGTRLTDVLSAQLAFVTHTAAYPLAGSKPQVLEWDLGTVLTTTSSSPIVFSVVGCVEDDARGELRNIVTATCATTDTDQANNHDQTITLVEEGIAAAPILVDALHYQGYETGQGDEAFRLRNVSGGSVDIGGWQVGDVESWVTFPLGASLEPGQAIWCAREATAFARQFGFKPQFEYGTGSDPSVPDMEGGAPAFADEGDECQLWDDSDRLVDALVYRAGNAATEGWDGRAIAFGKSVPTYGSKTGPGQGTAPTDALFSSRH